MDPDLIWLAGCVMISFTVQSVSGFGSVIIAVTLGAFRLPIDAMLPVVVPLDVLLNATIVARHRHHVDRRLLFCRILPLMVMGLAAGFALFCLVRSHLLSRIFSLLVAGLSAQELIRLFRHGKATAPLAGLKSRAVILTAGIVQGMFASGGPLLVYAVSRMKVSKAVFRSTLSALWLICNLLLTVSYLLGGRLDPASLKWIALLLPVMMAGRIAGGRLHHAVDERAFMVLIYLLLLFSALATLAR